MSREINTERVPTVYPSCGEAAGELHGVSQRQPNSNESSNNYQTSGDSKNHKFPYNEDPTNGREADGNDCR